MKSPYSRLAMLTLVAFMASASSTASAVTLDWIRQFGTDSDVLSIGYLARGPRTWADGHGNVYITGETGGSLEDSSAGGRDAFLRKYDDTGTVQWTRQLGTSANDRSLGVSVDDLGNVYISGDTLGDLEGPNAGDLDAFVTKYDAAGTLQWTRQLGTTGRDHAFGVSTDGLGNVYISGYTYGDLGGPNAGQADAFVVKYDASGMHQWTRQIGNRLTETNRGVSADGHGGVYITGYTESNLGVPSISRTDDAFVAKYDAAGTLQWTREFGTSSRDEAFDISTDRLGSIYITGYSTGGLGGLNVGGRDAFLAKYDTDGSLVWTRQLATTEHEIGYGVSADGLGNVYVSGYTRENLGGPNAGGPDVFLTKYDASGTRLWLRQFGTEGYDIGYGISADGLGNVYLSGRTEGNLGGPPTGPFDVFLAKFVDTLPGDFNHDGHVNAADYVVWRDGLGTLYTPGDYDVWQANFGATLAAGANLNQTVPEPTGLSLACLAIFALTWRTRRTCRLSRVVGFATGSSDVVSGFGQGSLRPDLSTNCHAAVVE